MASSADSQLQVQTKVKSSSHKKQGLLRSTSLVSFMTFLSRMMGFARDTIIAQLFGASLEMDAFIIAFRIPNFMRRLFAEGAFSQAFVPVLSEYQANRTMDEVRVFLAKIAGNLGLILFIVVLIGELFAPSIVYIFAPGFGEDQLRSTLASSMLRMTLPYLMLISLTAMAGAVLNTYGYFGVPALTPILLNLSLIFSALYLTGFFEFSVKALAFGVLLGGVLQLLVQLPFLARHQFLVRPRIMFRDPGVLRVLKLMVPALFGVSIAQINLLVDTIFASFLKVGSVTWLFYTDRLVDFPLGVFGVAIATVILPHLSKAQAQLNTDYFSKAIDWGVRLLLLIGVPSAVGLMTFGTPILSSFFGYRAFVVEDVVQTQYSLFMLALGVPAFMMVKVLAPGFYAKQDLKTPVKIGAICMILNTLLCALLIQPLQHGGLTLASSITGYVNALSLMFLLWRRNIYQPVDGWLKFLFQLIVSNVILGFYLNYFSSSAEGWMAITTSIRIIKLMAVVGSAAVVYFLTLFCLGVRWHQFRGQSLSGS